MVTTILVINSIVIIVLTVQAIAFRKAATELQSLGARLSRAARSLSV